MVKTGCLITRRNDGSVVYRCASGSMCDFNPLVESLRDKPCPYVMLGPIHTCVNSAAQRAAIFKQKESSLVGR